LFLLTGPSILHFFGISSDAFRMAGGILLLLIGIRIVTGEGGAALRGDETPTVASRAKRAPRHTEGGSCKR